jgi:hypothetical protein
LGYVGCSADRRFGLAVAEASADAIGEILGRASSCSDEVGQALGDILGSDSDMQIRLAVAGAIGKAKVDDARRASLLGALKKVGSPAAN